MLGDPEVTSFVARNTTVSANDPVPGLNLAPLATEVEAVAGLAVNRTADGSVPFPATLDQGPLSVRSSPSACWSEMTPLTWSKSQDATTFDGDAGPGDAAKLDVAAPKVAANRL